MEARALLRNVPIAPRKVRPIVDLIRGRKMDYALQALKFQLSPNAQRVEKLLLSVVANWENKYPEASLEKTPLYIKELRVDVGKSLKRVRPAPHGRAHRIRKRYYHLAVVVDALQTEDEQPKPVASAPKGKPKEVVKEVVKTTDKEESGSLDHKGNE